MADTIELRAETEEMSRALLVGVCTGREHAFEVSMRELGELALSCGIDPVRQMTQNLPWEDRATCVGPGKVVEIREMADAEETDLVIFNNTLSPSQIVNLSKALDTEVIDRTGLILRIFADHARSREARIQVEYARLKYMLPRLAGLRQNLSRQGGGTGSRSNRGAGEMQIELDRRHIERKMSVLRRELEQIAKNREVQRHQRSRNSLPLVSMVGYTNAGKSTLMNRLIDSSAGWQNVPDEENHRHVYVEDMVFATLDTTVRRISPEGRREFLLSDTVGLINDLPTALVEAFHSTLEEVLKADLILEVVDASDPEHAMHMEVTKQTLAELGAGDIPLIEVMNKSDLSDDPDRAGRVTGGNRIYISAADGSGAEELLGLIDEKLCGERICMELLIPYARMADADLVRRQGMIEEEEYTEEGLRLKAYLDMDLLRRCREYVTDDRR